MRAGPTREEQADSLYHRLPDALLYSSTTAYTHWPINFTTASSPLAYEGLHDPPFGLLRTVTPPTCRHHCCAWERELERPPLNRDVPYSCLRLHKKKRERKESSERMHNRPGKCMSMSERWGVRREKQGCTDDSELLRLRTGNNAD